MNRIEFKERVIMDVVPKMNRLPSYFVLLFILFVPINLSGCERLHLSSEEIEEHDLINVLPSQYPQFYDDMAYEGLKESIKESISYLTKIPPDREFVFGKDIFNAGHMLKSMERFSTFIDTKPTKQELNQFIDSYYKVYRSRGTGSNSRVLFTGYYEPILHGSPTKTDRYKFPIYSRPEDLISIDMALFSSRYNEGKIIGRLSGNTLIPYFERKQIDNDPLYSEKAKVIAWLEDPVDLFFLHIQGSGRIVFSDGKLIRVQYDTSNGRPYRSIGKYLIDEGKIPLSKMSMQAIRSYLNHHPEEMDTVFHYNPSYIFFKTEKDGPLGCMQTKLVPGRSIALDKTIFPLSALAFIETQKPIIDGKNEIRSWSSFSRFVMNQDTGGAIKGAGRVDLFMGSGNHAELAAGHLKHPGTLYFLILKPEFS